MKSIDLLKSKTIPSLSDQFVKADKILMNKKREKRYNFKQKLMFFLAQSFSQKYEPSADHVRFRGTGSVLVFVASFPGHLEI